MDWLSLERTTDPATEPVTLAEMRLWLKIDDGDTADNDIIESLIATARQKAEQYTNRSFIDQSWTIRYNVPCDSFRLPKPPLDSVTSINIIADDGTATLQSSDDYQVIAGEASTVFLESGNTWTSSTRPYGQMVVVYKSGYSDDADDLDDSLKTTIKQLTAYFYENREETKIPKFIESALNNYKVHNI